MENLKRLYFTLAAGIASLTGNKLAIRATEDGGLVSTRVSRDVNYYRTHFFNL